MLKQGKKNSIFEDEKEKLYPNGTLRLDILKSFGADLDTPTRENIIFVNKALIYQCGRHLTLRDIFLRDNDMHKNDQLFILMDDDVINITCLNSSRDGFLLLACTECTNKCEINIYNLTRINFSSFSSFKPRRKIITENYIKYIYSSFSEDGNTLGCIAKGKDNKIYGLIYDIQVNKKFKVDNYFPKFTFELPKGANKITFLNNKIFCISGKNYLGFWICYESMCKEIKSNSIHFNKNYTDHVWIRDAKYPLCAVISENNDLYLFTFVYGKGQMLTKKKSKNEKSNENDDINIEKFIIKQSITNIFNIQNNSNHSNNNSKSKGGVSNISSNNSKSTNEMITSTRINTYLDGLVIGSNKGNILFIEKVPNSDYNYTPVRYTIREREGAVTGLCFDVFNSMTLAISFKTNEIAYIGLENILTNLKNPEFDIKFNVLCEGFHNGPITCMDVASQRPIIITCSKNDKTIRIWNYLTGHCEYCKIILEERDNNEEKEINILSVAVHPNGYYLAISDYEMIRFFHLCYKELRFYNNDQVGNEQNKTNCTILKFSNEGHLLGAVNDKKIFILKSLTRETLKSYNIKKNKIISLYFHYDDSFFYTVDNKGNITQYNLFDFTISKFINNDIIYNDSIICKNYNYAKNVNSLPERIEAIDTIISVGENKENNKYVLSNIKFEPTKIETNKTKYNIGYIDEKGICCCNLVTKRYELHSYIVGCESGKIYLYKEKQGEEGWNQEKIEYHDSMHIHSKKINFIFYIREHNLIFSAGEDGNIFIYCIYEYPDSDITNNDENNKITISSKLNAILDEGLGDNVLINIFDIWEKEQKSEDKKNEIYKLQKIVDENNKNFSKIFKDKTNELNKQKNNEIAKLKQKIDEIIFSKNTMIEDYEKKIEEVNKEQHMKFVEREGVLNEKLEELNKQISELKEFNELMKKDFEKIQKDNNYTQLTKYRVLEFHLKNNVEDLEKRNKILEAKLTEDKLIEDRKLKIIENEHDYEMQKKIEESNVIIKRNNEELEYKINKIKKLNEKISELEYILNSNESKLKNHIEENERLTDTLTKLKNHLQNTDEDKTNINKKLTELQNNFNDRVKFENFLDNLKSNLYKKNYILSKKYNTEVLAKEDLKDSSKILEKQLEDTINLLVNKEKEVNKQKILITELNKKLNSQNKLTNKIKKDFDNLLKKIFDSYQTCDGKEIINSVREIYHKYLSNDAKKNYDSNKLNPNLRFELEQHIDYLQKQLTNKNEASLRKDKILNSEYAKKMQENAILLEEMTRVIKINREMTQEIKKLKEKNMDLTQTIEGFKSKENVLPKIIGDKEKKKFENKNGKEEKEKGINYIRNKMFRKDYKLTLDEEKNIKYNEMRKIIEGKNNLIQRLSTENDILRLNYLNTPNGCKTPNALKIKTNY